MRSGDLRYHLQVMRPEKVTDKFGHGKVTWTNVGKPVWAEFSKQSGQVRAELGESFADYSTVFNVRDYAQVKVNWRVRLLGGDLYTVVSVEPKPAKRFITLTCNRVNE